MYSHSQSTLWISCSWSVSSLPLYSDPGLQDSSISWLHCFLGFVIHAVHVDKGKGGVEEAEEFSEKLWSESDTHHFYLHSI